MRAMWWPNECRVETQLHCHDGHHIDAARRIREPELATSTRVATHGLGKGQGDAAPTNRLPRPAFECLQYNPVEPGEVGADRGDDHDETGEHSQPEWRTPYSGP